MQCCKGAQPHQPEEPGQGALQGLGTGLGWDLAGDVVAGFSCQQSVFCAHSKELCCLPSCDAGPLPPRVQVLQS
jgi:hypothetical protein